MQVLSFVLMQSKLIAPTGKKTMNRAKSPPGSKMMNIPTSTTVVPDLDTSSIVKLRRSVDVAMLQMQALI